MNKPVDLQTTKLEQAAPVVAVPVLPAPVSAKAEPSHPRSRKIWWITGSLSLALVVAIGVAWWLSSASGTVHYTTAPVTRGAVTRAVTATGTVNPVLTIIVGTYVSGVIQELSCDYNTRVKRAKSAPRSIRGRIRRSSTRTKRISTRPRRSSTRTRPTSPTPSSPTSAMTRLAKTNAVSKDAVDNAKSLLEQAQAQVGVDEATIEQRQAAARRRPGQSRLHQHRLAGRRHRRVAQRHHGPDGRCELPDADAVPDRHRPHQDAGRHQCQRKRHRRHQGRQQGDASRSTRSRAHASRARWRRCGRRRRPCRTW